MTPTLIILTWITVLAGKIVLDYHLIVHEKKSPNHAIEIGIVVLIAFFHQWLSGVNKIEEWELAGWILLFQASSWLVFFDGILNLSLNRPWFSYGETAWIDRQFQKLGMGAYVMSRVFALVLMVTAIIQIYKY